MVDAGLEMLIGITRDPALGVFLTVGRGGSQAEALRDVQCPARPGQRGSRSGRPWPSCAAGQRSSPAPPRHWTPRPSANWPPQISVIAAATPELAELDLNPVIVHRAGGGADIADALAVRRR